MNDEIEFFQIPPADDWLAKQHAALVAALESAIGIPQEFWDAQYPDEQAFAE